MKMTRRALAGMAALATLPVVKSAAQTSVTAPNRPDAAASASRQFQDAARHMSAFKLARTVEPAFRFEA